MLKVMCSRPKGSSRWQGCWKLDEEDELGCSIRRLWVLASEMLIRSMRVIWVGLVPDVSGS